MSLRLGYGLLTLGAACCVHGRAFADDTEYARTLDDRAFIFRLSDKFLDDDNLYRLAPLNTPGVIFPGAGFSTGDRINTAQLSLDGRTTVGLQAFSLKLNAADNRFSRNSELDNTSGGGKLAWNWSLGSQLSGDVGGELSRSLADFADTTFYFKDLVTDRNYYWSAAWVLGPQWKLKADARHESTSHGNDSRTGDDYGSQSGGFGVEYATSSVNSMGVDYAYTRVRFDQGPSLAGTYFSPNYDDNALSFYFKLSVGTATRIEAGAGYVDRKYPVGNLGVGNFSGDTWHASVQWQPSVQSGLKLSAWRDLRAYLEAASNYFVSTGASLAPVWSPIERVSVTLLLSYENQDFVGSNLAIGSLPQRRDSVTSEKLAIAYHLRERIRLDAAYRFEERKSELAQSEYQDKLASVRIEWAF